MKIQLCLLWFVAVGKLDDLENLVSQLGAQLCLTVLKKIFLPKNTNLIDVKIYI